MARNLVARELGPAVLDERSGLDGPRRDDERGHVLAPRARRHWHDVRRTDGRVAEQRRLDLGRGDVGARRLDHVLDAAEEVQRAALVETAEVTGVEEPVRVETILRREAVVVREQGRAAHADLAGSSGDDGDTARRVADAHLAARDGRPMAGRPKL